MKIITSLILALVIIFVVFRVLLPKLISTNNDSAVLAGAVIGLVVIYYGIRELYSLIVEGDENE